MNVLAVNCGSSTLKFQLLEVGPGAAPPGGEGRLAAGLVDGIGGPAAVEFQATGGAALRERRPVADHAQALRLALRWLGEAGVAPGQGIDAVGHRVVHGGERFVRPALIDDAVIAAIEEAGGLAPLHNAPALAAIRAARELLGKGVPMVAAFDTAFHARMPERAALYPLPPELARRHGVRRYGFHGLAHRYMTERYAALTGRPPEAVRLVTLQLGNGSSAAAVEGGRSLDTSMGLTPLEGLMMGTRCGDVDPSLAGYLARREGVPAEEVEDWLNTRCGLLGVSGRSRDMRELLAAEARGDEAAALAVEMFCYRARKYLGAYLAALGGAEAVVFGGGIGENAPAVRACICADMEWCGLLLDRERNEAAVGREARISARGARIHAYVIPVNEATVIARETVLCLEGQT